MLRQQATPTKDSGGINDNVAFGDALLGASIVSKLFSES